LQYAGAPQPFSMPEQPNASVDVLKQALFLDKGVTFVNASFWTGPAAKTFLEPRALE
jgi:hypothetical protein